MKFGVPVLVSFVFVSFLSVSEVNCLPRLVISPDGPVVKRPVKKPFVLTCKGEGDNPSLFSDLRWYDPSGNEITSRGIRGSRNETLSKIRTRLEGEKLLLSFREPSSNDGGVYECRGKFQVSVSLTANVDVSFYRDVTFENCPTSQSLVKGRSDGYIKCGVTADPPPIISWLKDDLPLHDDRYVIENNGIRVKGIVDEGDAGRFDVSARVEETGEVLYQLITIEVYVTPRVEATSQDRDAVEGEQVVLTCRTSGHPKPLVTWYDPSMRNLSEVGGYYVDRDHGVLTITRVRRIEDSGRFTCRAQNAAGEHQVFHHLEVISKPIITSFENISAVELREAVIECRATGSPTPILSLRQDGQDIPLTEGRDRIHVERRTLGDEAVLVVTILNVERRYDGLFYCSAENKGGRVDRVGHLTVEHVPDLSRTIALVKTWDSNPVNLTCIADSIPNATIYWIRRGHRLPLNGLSYEIRTYKGISNLLVKPLSAPGSGGGDVYGIYRCEAENVHGKSFIDINLERAYTPEQPGPVTITRTTPTQLDFDIVPPLRDGGLPIKRYRIRYRREHFDEPKEIVWPATGGPYTMDGLEPRMSYMIMFAAENDVGIGYWTPEQRIVMLYESVPDRVLFILPDPMILPESGELLSSSPSEFLVQWTKPQANGREIDEYRIRYHRALRTETGWQPVGRTREDIVREKLDLFYFKLHSLESDSFYRIEISAHNAIGWSRPSFLVVRTPPAEDGGGAASRIIRDSQTLAIVIGIVVLALLLILLLMDIIFLIRYETGAIYFMRSILCGPPKDKAPKNQHNHPHEGSQRSVV